MSHPLAPRAPPCFRRPARPFVLALAVVNVVFLVFLLSHATRSDEPTTLRDRIRRAKEILPVRFRDGTGVSGVPMRLRKLLNKHEIVGSNLALIAKGTETVEEIIHGTKSYDGGSDQPPMTLREIEYFITGFLQKLHEKYAEIKRATHDQIWQTYHDIAVKSLYPWDREYLQRMPERRSDGSIFLSLATYRDENCLNTITWAYEKSKNPEKLFVGLVQQNCESNCRSGVLEGGKMVDVDPDDDCYNLFCESTVGKPHCHSGRVRVLHINETESLGPYAARYFASKLWYGEEWYMQIDAHMTFLQDWDDISIKMLKAAPSDKPVLSHYPPSHQMDLAREAGEPSPRLCGPVFAESDLESQIIRLEGGQKWDKHHWDVPRFAPFTAAGYFVSHSGECWTYFTSTRAVWVFQSLPCCLCPLNNVTIFW
mmetsp:Transcript_7748/g.22774  ORF Transcript_7748/g.22774 Transcript_7748/m.22774 type:complete len:425 (-) Transcript_7748:519-1793(-)